MTSHQPPRIHHDGDGADEGAVALPRRAVLVDGLLLAARKDSEAHGISLAHFLAIDDGQDLLAHLDEVGGRLDLSRVARFEELVAEVELVLVGDSTRPRRHHDEPGGHEQRFLHAVGDEEHDLSGLLPHVEDQLLHGLAREGVERAERLVHEQHVGVAGQRAGEADALLHAAGELVDGVVLEVRQPDQGQVVPRPGPALGPRHPLELEPELGVLDHVEPREQGVLLEDDAPVPARTGDRRAPVQNRSRGGGEEARDDVEKRGLAAAGSSEGDYELVLLELEVHVLERLDAPEPLQGRNSIAT